MKNNNKEHKVGKEIRKYRCTGFGKEYIVEAPIYQNRTASRRAAMLYKKETGRGESVDFLACFFPAEVLNPRKTGRKPFPLGKYV